MALADQMLGIGLGCYGEFYLFLLWCLRYGLYTCAFTCLLALQLNQCLVQACQLTTLPVPRPT